MVKQVTTLPLAAMEKILKSQGADRVSEGAKRELASVLAEIGEDIGEHAIRLAHHAGRKTLKKSDIKLASK